MVAEGFKRQWPGVEPRKLEKFLGAEGVDYYVFTFNNSGKIQRAFYRPDGTFRGVGDVNEQSQRN